MFDRIKFSCGCGCQFEVNALRLEIKEELKCPNCLEVVESKELIAKALKLLQEARYENKKITFEILY